MTFAAASWALTLTLPSSPKFVLLVLANYSDENESCYPGISRLAENTGYSERSIKSSLAVLEQEGLISRERRYTHFGGRTSDRYLLHVGRRPLSADAPHPETSISEASVDELGASGANFAPDEADEPVDNPEGALGAKSAPDAQEVVDNPPLGTPLGATDAPLGATGAPLKEEQPDRTSRSSSSSIEVTTEVPESASEAAALPPDDDGVDLGGDAGDSPGLVDDGLEAWELSGPSSRANVGHAPSSHGGELEGDPLASDKREPLDLQRLLRAGIEVSLRELDARLNLPEILRRLSDAGVDGERVDVPAAAAFVLSAAARPVGDPSAYVATAIIREPARWPWNALPSTGKGIGVSSPSTCELEGHRYLDEYRMQCVRCGDEREGWREERYAAESDHAQRSRAVAS